MIKGDKMGYYFNPSSNNIIEYKAFQFEKQTGTLALPLDLQMFAKDSPTGQKTEEPTAKKKNDSRKEGQVAKSQELCTAIMLLALFVLLKFWIGRLGEGLMEVFSESYQKIPSYVNSTEHINPRMIHQLIFDGIILIARLLWPVMLMGIVVAFMSNRIQFQWMVTFKPMKPKLSKINPVSGIKRMFSLRTLMKTFVSIAIVAVISYLVYDTIKDKWKLLFTLYDLSIGQVISLVGDIVLSLGIKVAAVMLVIGVADYIFQKWKNHEEMKMSKKDVEEENKNAEGDPKIKAKRKRKQMEMAMQRMMQAVPKADVIITNPTHYAVAIEYKKDVQDAPVVVAKGTDYLALKIKERAREAGVEIVENRALARMLYNNVEISQEIPPELYQAVAEILAYVYRMKNPAS